MAEPNLALLFPQGIVRYWPEVPLTDDGRPTRNQFVLEVDWSGNGTFGETGEDITADVFSVECSRGRDYASQLIGRSSAGRLSAVLDNRDGKYSRFNTASPLFGNLLPNRKVRLRSTAPTAATLWTGYLDNVQAEAAEQPFATLSASGPFRKLGREATSINPAALANVNTGDVVDEILDAAEWPAGDRNIQAGAVSIDRWFIEDRGALAAMQEMEDTEGGFLYEGLAWDIISEGRYHRVVNSASSVATLSDAPASLSYILPLQQGDPLREVFNQALAAVTPYSTGSLSVLWTLSETPGLQPGQSLTWIAQYPNAASGGATGAYVDAWTTPVVGTDITQTGVSNGDIAVAVSKTANKMFITITNNHASAVATLTLVQARGTPVTKGEPFQVKAEDATSQADFGLRTFPLPSLWYPNASFAQAAVDYVVARYKKPRPVMTLTLPAAADDALFAHAVQRALSERVTVVATGHMTKLGINDDFFIESIQHRFGAREPLQTTFTLSFADPDLAGEFWVLGTSELGTDTTLAY